MGLMRLKLTLWLSSMNQSILTMQCTKKLLTATVQSAITIPLAPQIEDENCMRCHAESSATDEIACQECHSSNRFEAEYLNKIDADNTLYHRDKVGLKAAYHIRCMNCHEEMGVANGCQDCHSRTDAGDKFFHAGSYAPPESDKPAGGGH